MCHSRLLGERSEAQRMRPTRWPSGRINRNGRLAWHLPWMLTARELFTRAEELERRGKRDVTEPTTALSLLEAAQNLRRVAARLKWIEDDPAFREFIGRCAN